jgi:hypothetical protein
MSRTTHLVIQFLLLVVWAFVLMANNPRSASSQTCANPPYWWTNPLRNFWNKTAGNITVEMDELFGTHYPAAPDAAARIEAGQTAWNDQPICATVNFVGFNPRSFTESEKTSQPPNGKVYWIVAVPDVNSYTGIQPFYSGGRTVSARAKVHPNAWSER